MRRIQRESSKFKGYASLAASITAFCILWFAGAAIFEATERDTLGMTYFESLYFCYVSLLTIGYGDFAPQSNAGRAFFVVWSLLAVPTMTILVSHLGSTLVASFNGATNAVADFTVLPKYGVWRGFLDHHPGLLGTLQSRKERKERARRLAQGFPAGPGDGDAEAGPADGEFKPPPEQPPTLEQLATEADADAHGSPAAREGRLAKRLAVMIRQVGADLRADRERTYSYEEWVEITELIRFSTRRRLKRERGFARQYHRHGQDTDGSVNDGVDEDEGLETEEEEEGLIEWDWIGEDSPMMAGKTEPEFVHERLCESLARYMSAQEMMVPVGRAHGSERPRSWLHRWHRTGDAE